MAWNRPISWRLAHCILNTILLQNSNLTVDFQLKLPNFREEEIVDYLHCKKKERSLITTNTRSNCEHRPIEFDLSRVVRWFGKNPTFLGFVAIAIESTSLSPQRLCNWIWILVRSRGKSSDLWRLIARIDRTGRRISWEIERKLKVKNCDR